MRQIEAPVFSVWQQRWEAYIFLIFGRRYWDIYVFVQHDHSAAHALPECSVCQATNLAMLSAGKCLLQRKKSLSSVRSLNFLVVLANCMAY